MRALDLTGEDWLNIEREACKRSLATFIRLAWAQLEPGQVYSHGWHIDAVAEHLEAVSDGRITRLLINIPPGTMKSMMVGVFFPAWEWGPCGKSSYRFIGASHEASLAIRDNLNTRRLITSDWYQKRWPMPLTSDQNAKTYFQNMAMGWRQACAVTSMTGRRGDRVIWDDPHSVEDAHSEAALETATRVFKETLPTRLNNPDSSAIIIVMQRLSDKDVSGEIIENDYGYEHLMLPMEYEPGRKCKTLIGFEDPRTEPGELLFPERFPASVVARDKTIMGAYAVAGQFQQRPAPLGGSVFMESGIRYYLIKDLPAKFDKVVASWDATFKDTDGSDYVVGQVWGKAGANSYLLAQTRARMSFTRTVSEVIALRNAWPRTREILIEDKANGPAVIDTLKSSVPGIIPIEPDGSKLARAHAITSYWEAGNVWIPHPDIAPWIKDFVGELTTFPMSAHDDQVDAMTQALRRLYPLFSRLNITQAAIAKAMGR